MGLLTQVQSRTVENSLHIILIVFKLKTKPISLCKHFAIVELPSKVQTVKKIVRPQLCCCWEILWNFNPISNVKNHINIDFIN